MPFKNRIRLPFYITRPQYPRESNIFRRADGSTKVQSVIIRKVFEGETDNLPKEIHERLLIALSHDDVTIEGRYLTTGVSLDADYDIDWNKFLDYPLAKASFKVQVTPFNYSNDNCQTCEEAAQLSLDDDIFPVTLDEGQTYHLNVFANDGICCSPVTADIVIFDSLYIASASIDAASGIVTVTMQATIPIASNVNLLTYRVTCPNGGYDEADVFGDINGSIPACNTPFNLIIQGVTETTATIAWDQPSGALSYNWQLYLASDLFNPVQTGTANTADNNTVITGLSSGTDYVFYVQSVCSGGGLSAFSNIPFTTDGSSAGNCGQYLVCNTIFGVGASSVTWIDCTGQYANTFIPALGACRLICALENSPGDPVDIFASTGSITVTYQGPC